MSELWFYHLEKTKKNKALYELLQKCLDKQWRCGVLCGSQSEMSQTDQDLWDVGDESFLAHGPSDGLGDDLQPILISRDADALRGREVLVLGASCPLPDVTDYHRVLILFSGHSDQEMMWARSLWADQLSKQKASGHKKDMSNLSYWRQDEGGNWRKQV